MRSKVKSVFPECLFFLLRPKDTNNRTFIKHFCCSHISLVMLLHGNWCLFRPWVSYSMHEQSSSAVGSSSTSQYPAQVIMAWEAELLLQKEQPNRIFICTFISQYKEAVCTMLRHKTRNFTWGWTANQNLCTQNTSLLSTGMSLSSWSWPNLGHWG